MPAWCDKDPACWEAIVRYWRSDACYQEKNERRGRRLNNAGVAHHQGNRSLPQFMDAWSGAHGGEEINEVVGYALSHKGKATNPDNRYDPEDGPDAYTNANVQPKLAEYIAAFRRRHGEDKDPTQEPLDTELVMRLGGGKQHGSYWMANSAIDPTTTPTLREIRRPGSSSSSDIPIALRRPSTAQMLTQMEARFQQLQAHQEAQNTAHQQQLAAMTQFYQRQLADLAGFVRSQLPGTQELPPSLFAEPPLPVPAPVPGPAPSAGSNPTPGASPPLGPSPQHTWPAHPTYPTQQYVWPPPPQSQGYSSWPQAPTQQGPRPPYWQYEAAPQSGWTQLQPGWT